MQAVDGAFVSDDLIHDPPSLQLCCSSFATMAPKLAPPPFVKRAEPAAAAERHGWGSIPEEHFSSEWVEIQAKRFKKESAVEEAHYGSVDAELHGLRLSSARPAGFVPERHLRFVRGRPVVVFIASITRAAICLVGHVLRQPWCSSEPTAGLCHGFRRGACAHLGTS